MTHPTGSQAWVLTPGNQPGALNTTSQWPYLWQHSSLVLYYLSVRIVFTIDRCFVLYLKRVLVIRQILVRRNKKLDVDEKLAMEGANRTRVEEAAKLEGVTFEQAMEKRKEYRYLY